MKKLTQPQRILKVLKEIENVPAEYTKRIHGELWVSSRYFKQVMFLSECNARISELRQEGYDIATEDKDLFGFSYHRLISQPKKKVVTYETIIKDGVRYAKPIITYV